MENKIEKLNKLLTQAAGKLDKSAALVTELNLDKENNRGRIAEALANIFDIQHQIYELKPDLKPDYLRHENLSLSKKLDMSEDQVD